MIKYIGFIGLMLYGSYRGYEKITLIYVGFFRIALFCSIGTAIDWRNDQISRKYFAFENK